MATRLLGIFPVAKTLRVNGQSSHIRDITIDLEELFQRKIKEQLKSGIIGEARNEFAQYCTKETHHLLDEMKNITALTDNAPERLYALFSL